MDLHPGNDGGYHTGSLHPGTGGVRDSYNPSTGAAWSQAEYAEETLRAVTEGKKPLLTRIWRAVRRGIWGE